jgi:uncharacterized protein (TIGR03437 family)
MERTRKLFWGKTAAIMSAIPVLIWAHEYGPDAGYANVPKEFGACLASQCHVGTLNPSGGGVSVTFPSGQTYTPGVKQHLIVTITDASTTGRAWGFQLTARQSSATNTMAGALSSTDANTLLMCADPANLQNEQEMAFGTNAQGCPSKLPLGYIEHSLTGYNSTLQKMGSATYQFDWTPPASNIGNITLYVAANSGPATASPTQTGADVYTKTYTLTPVSSGPAPTIDSGGVANGASFQQGIVPNSWITIKGQNLSPTTDTWEKAIVNGKLPIALDGVGVKVGGKDAYVYYVSPTQINAIAPDVGSGSMQVTVTTPTGTSVALTASSNPLMPAFFLWPNGQAVATHAADGTFAVKNGTFAGATTVPAKPGEYVVLWGTGFGPTTPAAPVGEQTPSGTVYYSADTTVTVNGTPAVVYASKAALAPGFAGLYQVAVQIPSNAPDGDLPVVATVGGAQSPTGVVITVKH